MTLQTASQLAGYIPWLPALAAMLCGLCCTYRKARTLAAPICIAGIFAAFVLTLLIKPFVVSGQLTGVTCFSWINIGHFSADFAYLFDSLTIIMLMVITGIGTLVAVYAAGYMAGDKGYARFFAGVSLFIFAMTNLVMADNLVLLYLGWEGVGVCSYLLIGYYYEKPSAVAAAKKAFIVNRIGDLGFALGIFLTYTTYDTVSLSKVIQVASAHFTSGQLPSVADHLIPFLLMLGAFGKSAQLPLYVWLPDAMEGPTPVSALIHAATMVTAGVYMIARLVPVFQMSPYALPTVAIVGGLTALFAGTIALCQYDIKRIFAYSTVSQLGYLFLAVGTLTATASIFHLLTHAFFKALLFLTAGSVMHALAGQLDLRKMSGLRHKMPVTCWLMFVGCLALAGFPFTAGFYSKDMILAHVLERGINERNLLYIVLAAVALFTALLTAFYTFRLWFRVFMGPEQYEMGDEHHQPEEAHGHDASHENLSENAPKNLPGNPQVHVEHVHEPHEMPWLMNGPLVLLAVGALLAGYTLGHGSDGQASWIESMVDGSTAKPLVVQSAQLPAHTAGFVEAHIQEAVAATSTSDKNQPVLQPSVKQHSAEQHSAGQHSVGQASRLSSAGTADPPTDDAHNNATNDVHEAHDIANTPDIAHAPHEKVHLHSIMMIVSSCLAIIGILAAAYFHWLKREAADRVAQRFSGIVRVLENKYYVDEIYDAMIVQPLKLTGDIFFAIDRLILDGLVALIGFVPRCLGLTLQPTQNGMIQGYGLGMVVGVATILIFVFLAT